MSGREQTIFSFETGHQIEQHILSVHAETIEGLSSKDRRTFKAHLVSEIAQISNALSAFLSDTLNQQSSILEKYLNEHVFYVPGSAVLAISPLDVPMPAKVVDESSVSASNATKRSKKASESQETEKEKGESLKTVLTNIHKTEYFLSRLKQLYDENEQYIDVLNSILTSLLQLEETTKNHDAETSAKQVLATLDSSMAILGAIQAELDSKGVSHNLKVPETVQTAQ